MALWHFGVMAKMPQSQNATKPKRIIMSDTPTGRYWILFLVSTLVMIAMLIWMNEWFWLALPFSLTFFVKALDVV